jgi:ornithine cyclodeaminase/alanine dehydrogenase-like protein (mu-crystallin family)
VFGSGKQIEAHIDLHLRAYSSIERVAIVNRTVPRATGLMTRLLPRHPTVQFTATALEGNNFRTFLSNAAIIIAATSSTTPLFGEDERFVRTGAHIILVGSYKPEMQEVSGELLHRSGNRLPGSQMRVVVDSREACLKEAGELIRTGVSPEDLVEIGELVSESEDGNLVVNEEKCEAVRAAGDITIFKSVGVGVQDVAITDYVVRRVEEAGLGTVVQNYYS